MLGIVPRHVERYMGNPETWGWEGALKMRLGACGCVVIMAMAGCQQKTPTAQAEAPGKAPSWGQGFGAQQPATPATPPSAALAEVKAPVEENPPPTQGQLAAKGLPLAPRGTGEQGGMPQDSVHAGLGTQGGLPTRVGGSGTDWGGGDLELGKREFGNRCARCHGMDGKGGVVANVGKVPSLTRPEFHAANGDAQIASAIAHGKDAMPSFMGELTGESLRALVAFVRTLKK